MNITQWPADNVERRAVVDLIPYERNARTHSPEQVDQIAASMQEWGWTVPILVDEDGQIIAGHGRLAAARNLDIEEVPVMVASGWTDAQKKAYSIADNQLALNAGWDMDMLTLEFKDLKEWGFDGELTGFPTIDDLLADRTDGLTDPDDVPEADPISEVGDVWELGKHRLMCGDSTSKQDVDALLEGAIPHLMVTDPPYGVSYDPDWRNVAERANGTPFGASAVGTVDNDDRADWREAWALFPGDVAYVWHAGNKAHVSAASIEAAGFAIRAQIIWCKNNIVIGRGHYHGKHEPCWYAVREGKTGHWNGDRKQSTVWMIDKPMKSETGHSTQKPVECMRKPVINNSKANDAVYDPFMGSGTTIIACEMEARVCYGMELNPEYVDIAVKRWEQFTGREAVRHEAARS